MPRQWFPFYVNDYVGDTMRLTTLEHGAYLLILIDYWARHGPPPDDDVVLKNITKMSPHNWKIHKGGIKKYFRVENGLWHHDRMDKEIEKAKKYSDIQAERRRGKTKGPKEPPVNRRNVYGLTGEKPPTPTPIEEEGTSSPCRPEDLLGHKIEPKNGEIPGLVMAAWNTTAEKLHLPIAQVMNGPRPGKAQARWKDAGGAEGIDVALKQLETSNNQFLMGSGDTGWKANIDWFLRPTIFASLIEGAYDRKPKGLNDAGGGDGKGGRGASEKAYDYLNRKGNV